MLMICLKKKLFAGDATHQYLIILRTPKRSAAILNSDLNKISEWAQKWNMSFNLDPPKQAQEVLFSHETTKASQSNLMVLTRYKDLF